MSSGVLLCRLLTSGKSGGQLPSVDCEPTRDEACHICGGFSSFQWVSGGIHRCLKFGPTSFDLSDWCWYWWGHLNHHIPSTQAHRKTNDAKPSSLSVVNVPWWSLKCTKRWAMVPILWYYTSRGLGFLVWTDLHYWIRDNHTLRAMNE